MLSQKEDGGGREGDGEGTEIEGRVLRMEQDEGRGRQVLHKIYSTIYN